MQALTRALSFVLWIRAHPFGRGQTAFILPFRRFVNTPVRGTNRLLHVRFLALDWVGPVRALAIQFTAPNTHGMARRDANKPAIHYTNRLMGRRHAFQSCTDADLRSNLLWGSAYLMETVRSLSPFVNRVFDILFHDGVHSMWSSSRTAYPDINASSQRSIIGLLDQPYITTRGPLEIPLRIHTFDDHFQWHVSRAGKDILRRTILSIERHLRNVRYVVIILGLPPESRQYRFSLIWSECTMRERPLPAKTAADSGGHLSQAQTNTQVSRVWCLDAAPIGNPLVTFTTDSIEWLPESSTFSASIPFSTSGTTIRTNPQHGWSSADRAALRHRRSTSRASAALRIKDASIEAIRWELGCVATARTRSTSVDAALAALARIEALPNGAPGINNS